MSGPLLTTKLHIPRSRPELVPRRLLLEKLHAGLHRKLTLVSAPAGFGKTTLASSWASELLASGIDHADIASEAGAVRSAGVDVAWLSLDEGDNDPAQFLGYLVAALSRVDSTIGAEALNLLRGPQLPSPEVVVGFLVNEVAARQRGLVLVLDDLQVLTEIAVHHIVEFLLEHQPANMHLVITTRIDPPLPLSRLRARGQLTEIRQRDLRFTSEESEIFLRDAMGLPLSADQVQALEASTEGWIAGLQLAALSMQGRDAEQTSRFLDGFSGRHRFILDYLTDEVLQRLPEDLQRFLLYTSILNRMCGPLCDAVLESEGQLPAKERLLQLEASNLFTVPLDDERTWYRYHALFAELLQARLRETEPDRIPGLHRRAAAWYQAAGLRPEAVQHALASGDSALAAEVIERAITQTDTWSHADSGMVLRWLRALPEDAVRPRPWLRLFASRTLFVSGQPERAAQVLADLDAWLRAQPSLPDATRLSALVIADWASFAAVLGDIQQAKDLAQRLRETVRRDDPIARFRPPAILGMAHLRAGEARDAYQAFRQAADVALAADLNFAAVPFLCNVAETLIVQGQLQRALQTCEQARQLSSVDGQPIYAAGFVDLEMGKIRYEWNELQMAEDHLRRGLVLLAQGGINEGFGSMNAVLAQVLQARGEGVAALAAVQQAVQVAEQGNIPRLILEVTAYRAQIWLAQGYLDLARAWARDYQKVGETEYLREFEDLTLARLLLAEGRSAEALRLLDPMVSSATSAGRMGPIIEIQALRALAWYAQDAPDDALRALREAIVLGEPEGYVRTFVDLGQALVPLLKRLASQGTAPEYASHLLAALSSPGERQPGMERQPLVEPLTERELEVLQLLADRLSNREIGRRLFISLPTVKSHTSSIYGKLGVNGREQAVARARALAILAPE